MPPRNLDIIRMTTKQLEVDAVMQQTVSEKLKCEINTPELGFPASRRASVSDRRRGRYSGADAADQTVASSAGSAGFAPPRLPGSGLADVQPLAEARRAERDVFVPPTAS